MSLQALLPLQSIRTNRAARGFGRPFNFCRIEPVAEMGSNLGGDCRWSDAAKSRKANLVESRGCYPYPDGGRWFDGAVQLLRGDWRYRLNKRPDTKHLLEPIHEHLLLHRGGRMNRTP